MKVLPYIEISGRSKSVKRLKFSISSSCLYLTPTNWYVLSINWTAKECDDYYKLKYANLSCSTSSSSGGGLDSVGFNLEFEQIKSAEFPELNETFAEIGIYIEAHKDGEELNHKFKFFQNTK